MVGTLPPVTADLAAVPSPRRPLPASDRVRRWYEDELGWPTEPGTPVRLRVGPRFDVLDVPAEAGRAVLRHLAPGSPVALQGGRMRLLVAAGSAREVPGVLDWLEWGSLTLDLVAVGEGGLMDAPPPPGPGRAGARSVRPAGSGALQGAAVWLRPPGPGGEAEASLPAMPAVGGVGDAPDLVRVLGTAATQCHRLRLTRACAQPLAFS